jgi:hypothetical protein
MESVAEDREKFVENLFSRKIIAEIRDPYAAALDVMVFFSQFGKINQRKNLYETDGPHKRVEIEFDVISLMTRQSRLVVHVAMRGEIGTANFLEVDTTGDFVTGFEVTEGTVHEAFVNYYNSEISPFLRNAAEKKCNEITVALDIYMKNFAKK